MNRYFTVLFIFLCTVAIYLVYMSRASLLKLIGKSGAKHSVQRKFLIDFKNSESDVLVFLHIQKAGGTILENTLMRQIQGLKCRCDGKWKKNGRCKCLRENGLPWIVMRYTAINGSRDWPCGLHPDITALKHCIPLLFKKYPLQYNFKFLYMTQLRDPVRRYVSEFRHVQRSNGWENANMMCKNKQPSENEFACFKGVRRENITLETFLACEKNLANNRQTRMLANLELVDCYTSSFSKTKRDRIMLKSAKENLKAMTYFSLTENPAESQFIFEKTFNLRFNENWFLLDTGYANEYIESLSELDLLKIREVNKLDIELYQYAKQLFKKQLKFLETLTSDNPKESKIKINKKGKEVLRINWKRRTDMGKRPSLGNKKKFRKKKRKPIHL